MTVAASREAAAALAALAAATVLPAAVLTFMAYSGLSWLPGRAHGDAAARETPAPQPVAGPTRASIEAIADWTAASVGTDGHHRQAAWLCDQPD